MNFKYSIILILIVLGFPRVSFSQVLEKYPQLERKFTSFEVVNLDSRSIYRDIIQNNGADNFEMVLPGNKKIYLTLYAADLIAPEYNFNTIGENETTVRTGTTVRPMRGFVNGVADSEAALTFNDKFIYGFIRIRSEEYYIEPVHHLLGTNEADDFVMYRPEDVIPDRELKCAYDLDNEKAQEIRDSHEHDANRTGLCYQIRYAIASDWSMRFKYGSVTGVENHNIGVLNDVQTNYDNEFADELSFTIVQQFVVNCSTCDPWTNSTDAGTLLSSFRNWAPSGFNTTHDLGCLWTNRDLDGSTIGIAYLGVLCTSSKYHVLQDFSSNASLLRCMASHEIGHNFNADHDPSGSSTIMAPAVSTSNTWSAASKSAIEGEYMSASCLQFCPGGGSAPVANFTYSIISACSPGQVQYTDNSTNAVSRSWSFPGGLPSSSTALNPLVSYSNPGTYNATLTVYNSSGSSNSKSVNNVVTVISLPVVSFLFTVNGNTTSFTFTGSNATSVLWNFGDGTTSSQTNPQHVYSGDGVYNVTLTATNSCGSNNSTQQVTIVTPPVANFTPSVQYGCNPLTVTFLNESSTNSTSFTWNFPGGSPSSSYLQSPTVIYNSPGIYNVTLTVSNNIGTDVKVGSITVYAQTTPAFTSNINGSLVNFINNSTSADSYLWSFGDGQTSQSVNPSHTYVSNGTYNVKLTANNWCGSVSLTQQVTIAAPPLASFTPTSAQNICVGQSVAYTNTSTYSPTTYQWTFEGGNPATSTVANPSVTYNAAGNYDVSLIVTNAFGSDTLTQQNLVSVTAMPVAAFTQSVSGLTVQFTSSSQNASGLLWDFGDGQTSTQLNPLHIYANEGTYNVVLTASNSCGNNNTTSAVTLLLPPVASFSSGTMNICPGQTVNYVNQSTGNSATYQWSFEGGNPATSSVANPTVTYATAGSYDVTLIVTNAAGADTMTIQNYVTVTPLATANFTQTSVGLTVNFTSQVQNATSILWNFGDGQTSTAANPTHTYASEGSYTITLTASNQCGDVTFTKNMLIVLQPVAMFGATVTQICQGQSVSFINQSSANSTSFNWTFEGGIPATSTAENPVVSYASPGVYGVTLTVSNSNGQNTLSQPGYITVVGPVPVGFQSSVTGNVITLTNTASPVDSVQWTVSGNGFSQTATGSVASVTVPANGSYTITQITYGFCGYSVAGNSTVEVTGYCTASFSAGTGCPGQPVTVNNNSVNATSYQWILEGGNPSTSTEANPPVIYSQPGTYQVTLIASNGLGSDTFTSSITVIPLPVASFDFVSNNGQADFTFTGSNTTEINWDFGDGGKANGTMTTHTYTKTGSYIVTVRAVNACGQSVITKTIDIIVSSTTDISLDAIRVSPNPNNGQFNVSMTSKGTGTAVYSIADISGRLVDTGTLRAVNGVFNRNFDLGNTASATYILIIREDDRIVRKLVVAGMK